MRQADAETTSKTIATKSCWIIANAVWNTFFALCLAVAVFALFDAHVAGEAAPIGLVAVEESPLLWTLVIGQFVGWAISTSCGWAVVFEAISWPMVAAACLINS